MKRHCKGIVFILAWLSPVFMLSSQEAGETVLIEGRVLDTAGNPVGDAVVELWQADVGGNYNHPRDTQPGGLLDSFQYFGTSRTDPEGAYSFLTVKPSPYSGRPAHLHIKVKVGGEERLTTQFYFPEDRIAVEGDGVFAGAGDSLFLKPATGRALGSGPVRVLNGDIVLEGTGLSPDRITATPDQTEGPYYPVVDFSEYDNDLTDPDTGQEDVRLR